jgi:hypothetical protein
MSILVPLDGSVRAEAAIGPAMQLIEALSAPARGLLRLARVVILPDANKTSLSERETIMQEAKTYLSSIAERIQAERVAGLNLAMSWCVTIDDDLAGGIVRMAEVGECVEGEEAFPGSSGFFRSDMRITVQARLSPGALLPRTGGGSRASCTQLASPCFQQGCRR